MKKQLYAVIIAVVVGILLQGCGSQDKIHNNSSSSESLKTNTLEKGITKEMAYEGVYNYCDSVYDWSIAREDPSKMYLKMGEESETEYQVIYRSYTGAFVYFYVNKLNGTTRMTEYVPTLDIENEAGVINLHDYLKNNH